MNYTAVAERSGDWWAITVPQVGGVFTQTKRLDKAADMARDAIALLLDVDPSSFDVTVEVDLPDEVRDWIRDLEQAKKEADDAAHRAADLQAEVAKRLIEKCGLSMRDAGKVMGVSFQRIGQLAH